MLLHWPLFYIGGLYITILRLIAFIDPRRFRSDLNYLIYKHLTQPPSRSKFST
jgi:hypothetical protein